MPIADEIGAVLAPVGEKWWPYMKNHPEAEMYYKDGAHASESGSLFAAKCIWEAIYKNHKEKDNMEEK